MTKLEKLLDQVAKEKARLAVGEKAKKTAAKIRAAKERREHIAAAAALVVDAGLAGVPLDFLRQAFGKIAEDYASVKGESHE